jgi:predicted transcriptional regulator
LSRAAKGEGGDAGRKRFLVHIDADIVRRVEILAIDRGVSAPNLVQRALTEFLDRDDAAPKKS